MGRRFIYMVDALVDLDVCSSARGVVSLHRHLNKRGTARSAVGTWGVRGTFRYPIEPIICRTHRGPSVTSLTDKPPRNLPAATETLQIQAATPRNLPSRRCMSRHLWELFAFLAVCGMAPHNEHGHQPSKRRKVRESCKICRAKKTRCDGQRPVCSPCVAKGAACEYDDMTVPVSSNTLAEIEARLRHLERQSTATWQSPRNTAEDQGRENDSTFADNPTTQFLSDMTQVAGLQSSASLDHASIRRKSGAWLVETDTSSMVVPRRATADELIDCYERFVYPLFPILHLPSFRASYMCLWEPERPGPWETLALEATFYATLNIVFALGCINNSNVEPHLKLRTAENFYRRARTLMPLDALDSPSLEVVQYLLLTTHYLSFTKYSHRCGNTLAVAIRVSQTLGLHVDKESSSKSQLRREMSRRVWHLCITMERYATIPPLTWPLQPILSKTAVLNKNRLLSSLFGWRALTQLDGKVPLPSAIDDEYLLEDGEGVQPPARPSLLDSFIATIKIFDVFHRAPDINDGYFARALCLPELAQVLQLNEELDQIDASLPAHLRSDNHEKPSTRRGRALSLQAVAVKIRFDTNSGLVANSAANTRTESCTPASCSSGPTCWPRLGEQSSRRRLMRLRRVQKPPWGLKCPPFVSRRRCRQSTCFMRICSRAAAFSARPQSM